MFREAGVVCGCCILITATVSSNNLPCCSSARQARSLTASTPHPLDSCVCGLQIIKHSDLCPFVLKSVLLIVGRSSLSLVPRKTSPYIERVGWVEMCKSAICQVQVCCAAARLARRSFSVHSTNSTASQHDVIYEDVVQGEMMNVHRPLLHSHGEDEA